MRRWIVLLAVCVMLWGCGTHTGRSAPAGWRLADVRELEAATPTPQELNSPAQAKMQVFVCYGWVTSNHTCMRLEGPGDASLFWDPGGSYGHNIKNFQRHGDVMLDQYALSLDGLWEYRRVGCDEPAMVMFEWSLTQEQARASREMLIHGQGPDGPGGSFDAASPGGFCSMYLSEFLMRFCQDKVPLKKKWFWPHNLAVQLWQCSPDRVLIYERNQSVQVYVAQ